jgi:hypothetical protein
MPQYFPINFVANRMPAQKNDEMGLPDALETGGLSDNIFRIHHFCLGGLSK